MKILFKKIKYFKKFNDNWKRNYNINEIQNYENDYDKLYNHLVNIKLRNFILLVKVSYLHEEFEKYNDF